MRSTLTSLLVLAFAACLIPGAPAQDSSQDGPMPDSPAQDRPAQKQNNPAPGKAASAHVPANLPSCTDSLSNLAFPNAPHGLFAIMFPNPTMHAKLNPFVIHNPVVCGANFYLVWNQIDKGPGASPRYDWSRMDEEIAPWIAAGKEINFIVWATGYGQGNGTAKATPDYVFRQTPSVDCPNAGTVPVFWEKGFVTNYQEFMRAVVQKYGGNASVGYIRFGLGIGGETYPACMYALKSRGFSPERWRHYIIDMLDFEASLNSPKQLMVGINTFGNPPDMGFADAVAKHAAQHGIAIGSQTLSFEDAQNERRGSPCAVDWCRNFHEAEGKVPLELQTRKQSNPDRNGIIGSMVDLLPFALHMRTQIIEVYPEDWLVAYDPDDPAYAQYHQEYQQAYESAAKVLGGHP
jgi:hypothetical protein